MDRNVIILVIVAVVSTGCASGSSGGIQVTDFSVQPSEVFSGGNAYARLEAVNAGNLGGEVNVGDEGENVLVNHCPDVFNVNDFTASSSTVSEEEGKTSFELNSSERIRLNWQLEQKDDRTIPRSGFSCDMAFELPFDYSVTGYKQIQIKEDREVENIQNLKSDVSGGPLTFDFQLVGSSTGQNDIFLEDDEPSIRITTYNSGSSENGYQGLIEIEELNIETSDNIDFANDCGSEESKELASEDQSIYNCPLEDVELSGVSSIRGEIRYSADYTFVKEVGSRTVEVKRSES